METYEPYLLQETAVIEYINYHLKYGTLEDQNHVHAGVEFSTHSLSDEITVEIYYPLNESLDLEIKNDRIYDYQFDRSIVTKE